MAAVWQTAQEFCRALLLQGDLESKLAPPRGPVAGDARSPGRLPLRGPLLPFAGDDGAGASLPAAPARAATLAPARLPDGDGEREDETSRSLSPHQSAAGGSAAAPERGFAASRSRRLPSLGALADPGARIACLSRFAHHELQAIELFAWAILRFPQLPLPLRRGFLLVLEEEQDHLRLYLDRLRAHGATLSAGQSDYLWRHTAGIEASPDPVLAFLSAVGLTFEQANLDFAGMYRDAFLAAGDVASAEVLAQVHRDEIRHVRLAVRWLGRLKQPGESDLSAYLRAVPFPLSPARAKGRRFDLLARRQAGLSDEFIAHIAAAQPYRSPGLTAAGAGGAEADAATFDRDPAAASLGNAEESVSDPSRLWLLPNLGGEEEDQPLPKSARGFLRGLHGAWAALFPSSGAPWLLPPGDAAALAAWTSVLPADPAQAALPQLGTLWPSGESPLISWINTPGAEAQAATLRRQLLGPSAALVQVIHHKGFAQQQAAELGLQPSSLAGLIEVLPADLCRDPQAAGAALERQLATWPTWLLAPPDAAAGDGERRLHFVLKPALGTSGRGRVHGQVAVTPDGARRILTPPTATAWGELARRGGAVLEPWLQRRADFSVQLAIPQADESGGVPACAILGTTTQVLTPSGQIRGNRGRLTEDGRIVLFSDDDTAAAIESALTAGAEKLAAAAAARGFYGIAGIDAFTFVGPEGRPVLRPIVELNARFTTGTIAVGLLRRAQQAGLIDQYPQRPQAWAFLLKAPRGPLPASVRCLCPLPRGPALLWAPTATDLDALCAG